MLILAYHRVNPAAKDGLSVTPAMLEKQLTYLVSHGWANVALEEVIASGELAAKTKEFAITFDDGYQDNYIYALPVLERLELKATLFIAAAYTDTLKPFPWLLTSSQGRALLQKEDLPLTWGQIKLMLRSGRFSIGSHTLTHPFLSRLTREAACQEIGKSKLMLEDQLQIPVSTFCYPAGDFNQETLQLVASAGYAAAVVTPNRFIPETPLTLHRVGVYRTTTMRRFKFKTSGLAMRAQRSRSGWWLRRELSRWCS